MTDEPDLTADDDAPGDELEVVDGLPVLSADDAGQAIAHVQPGGALIPSRQVAALAATGFVAGAATVAMVHRRRTRALPRRKRKNRTLLGEVVTSNSFLVDVHLLRRD